MIAELPGRVFLLRHGETEWSANGRHTGRTDIPLTDDGRAAATRAGSVLGRLRGMQAPARVSSSPRTRAVDTARLAGLHVDAVDERLAEWDYGDAEGRTTPQIRESLPGWTIWDGPWPGGETPDDVTARADAVLGEVRTTLVDGDVVLVGHGHFGRVLAARWIGMGAAGGVHLRMDPASVTVLGFERGVPRLDHVNQTAGGSAPDDPRRASGRVAPMSGVREAGPRDVDAVVGLVYELAEYEKARDECRLTADLLRAALFGPDPVAHALVAVADGVIVGTAIWFRTFSTWEGVAGMHLEDLYVRPAHRGGGHGARLLAALARICDERGWARLEWNVLDWNAPALGFYRALGAVPNDGWTTYRLTGDALRALAGR